MCDFPGVKQICGKMLGPTLQGAAAKFGKYLEPPFSAQMSYLIFGFPTQTFFGICRSINKMNLACKTKDTVAGE
jgi:hypothetical protein